MIVQLSLIREHGNFDSDDISDTLLTQYYDTAVKNVETCCHRPLVSDTDENAIAQSESDVPADIKQFLLVMICDYAEKRERISEKALSQYHNHLLDKYILY